MKYMLIAIIAVMTFVGAGSIVAKYQIAGSGMVLANAESGISDPTNPSVNS